MTDETKKISSEFPDDTAPAAEKEGNEWGLQTAEAIWYQNSRYSPRLFYNNRDDYSLYIDYALGDQSADQYKPMSGINPEESQKPEKNIRWEIKNYITKRVNAVISKVFNRQYAPIANAIDQVSIDKKREYESSLKVYSAFMSEWQALGLTPDNMPEELLPMDNDDVAVFMENNYKTNDEIDLELGVQHHLKENNYEDAVRYKSCFDSAVLGVQAQWAGFKEERPTVEWKNPAKIIVPWSEENDFRRIKYAAYVDDYTIEEWRKLHGGEFDPEKEKEIIKEYGKNDSEHAYRDRFYTTRGYPEVDKILVMHFEVKTTNESVMLQLPDKAGQMRSKEKLDTYYKGKDDEFKEKYGKSRKLIRKPYSAVYTGYWIVGTKYIFGYGLKNYNTGELGYKMDASFMRDGRTVSLVKQMKPCVDLLTQYEKKIQQLVAAAVPKGATIDLAALRKVSFKMGGKKMTDVELFELWRRSGILIIDSDAYGVMEGDTRKAIEEQENGISKDIEVYLGLMRNELINMDEIIGANAASFGGDIPERQGKAVTEMMVESTDVALDHIYQGDRRVTTQVYKELGELHKIDVTYGDPQYYINHFGKAKYDRMKESYGEYDYSVEVEAMPTRVEWQQLYQELEKLEGLGKIEPEDKFAIKRINNLKQAETMLRVLTKRRKKEVSESVAYNAKVNADEQTRAANQATLNQAQLQDKKHQNDKEMAFIKLKGDKQRHQWKLEEITKTADVQGEEKMDQIEEQGRIDKDLVKLTPKAPVSNT